MEKKQQYFDRVIKLAKEYPKILVVEADNVGSHHLQKIRKSLLGEAVILMGKNVRGVFSSDLTRPQPDLDYFFAGVTQPFSSVSFPSLCFA